DLGDLAAAGLAVEGCAHAGRELFLLDTHIVRGAPAEDGERRGGGEADSVELGVVHSCHADFLRRDFLATNARTSSASSFGTRTSETRLFSHAASASA